MRLVSWRSTHSSHNAKKSKSLSIFWKNDSTTGFVNPYIPPPFVVEPRANILPALPSPPAPMLCVLPFCRRSRKLRFAFLGCRTHIWAGRGATLFTIYFIVLRQNQSNTHIFHGKGGVWHYLAFNYELKSPLLGSFWRLLESSPWVYVLGIMFVISYFYFYFIFCVFSFLCVLYQF